MRLTTLVSDIADREANLFTDFANNGSFCRLASLDEAGQHRHSACRPLWTAGQHTVACAIVDEHDHRGVGTGEMLRGINWAQPAPASLSNLGVRTTSGTARVPQMPCLQRDRGSKQADVEVRKLSADFPQPTPAGLLRGHPCNVARQDREVGNSVCLAE